MRVLVAVATVLTSATPLAAQTTTAPAPAAAPAAAAKYSIDTPIETIAADPAGKAVLDTVMPGVTTHAMYEQFKAMSLKQLAPMSGGKITDEGLAKANEALAAVK
jgi:hypothetical protein